MKSCFLACALIAALALPVRAQEPPAADTQPDGVAALVARLQQTLQAGDRARLATFVSPELMGPPPSAGDLVIGDSVFDRFAADFIAPDVRRGVALECDRSPLPGSLPRDGFRLIVAILT